MAIQNLSLAAVELGLGTHIKTGGVMGDAAARAAANVRDNERIVAIVNVGTPAEIPPAKKREPAQALTNRVPQLGRSRCAHRTRPALRPLRPDALPATPP